MDKNSTYSNTIIAFTVDKQHITDVASNKDCVYTKKIHNYQAPKPREMRGNLFCFFCVFIIRMLIKIFCVFYSQDVVAKLRLIHKQLTKKTPKFAIHSMFFFQPLILIQQLEVYM